MIEQKGLTDKEVEEARKKHGSNVISKKKKKTFFKQFLETLGDPIIKILLIALVIKTVFLFRDFDWFETLGIVIAIFLSSLISTVSEVGSEKAFERLQEEASRLKAKVKRNGDWKEISVDDLVVGDLIKLESGDKVPADAILVEGELTVDESSLSGESKEKYKEAVKNTVQEKNKIYRGTVVYSKMGLARIEKVGNDTYYGRIALELQEENPESPMKARLRVLAQFISKIGYIGAFLVAFSYLFSVIVIDNQFNPTKIMDMIGNFRLLSGHILYSLTLAVTIIVVAVPEGLPMMITLVLSSNMKRMLKNNVLVRKLVGIETAGSINILYTDKTGTLTKGKLEVVGVLTGTFHRYDTDLELSFCQKYHDLLKVSLVYNNECRKNEKGELIGGNLTDRSLLSFVKSEVPSIKVIKQVPFHSKNKYSSCLIESEKKLNLIKGAPEFILPKCNFFYNEKTGKKERLEKEKLNQKMKEYTKVGFRLLCIAVNDRFRVEEMEDLTLVGLILLKDEIRKEAIEGVKLVKDAGIQTVMITGDNLDTAIAIGKEVGLITSEKDLTITHEELSSWTDEEVKRQIPNLKIVARSLPQDKSRLVRLSEEMGLVVGMTGDGVNDAPALKKADVGFAMGSGTEVAKEASEIVILDDNFLSITKAILFGRTIFKSIRKFIIFQLTVNLCAISLSIIGPFIGIETPVTVIQMLWINMIMDTLAGIAFAYEPPLLEYMKEKPKKREEPIMNQYMLNEILFTGSYSALLCVFFLKNPWIESFYRIDPNQKYLMTAFFGLFIFMGIFNCFNARTSRLNLVAHIFWNKAFVLIISFIVIVQLILIYFGGNMFRTFGLTCQELFVMILLASTVIPVDWLRKMILKRKTQDIGV